MTGTIGFGVIAACMMLSALFVVRAANLIHAVLWLGVTLATTAALYVMLGAPFLAGVQVLLYVGGVLTLMIFGVMVTRRHEGLSVQAEQGSPLRGMVAAAALFGGLAAAVNKTEGLAVSGATEALPTAEIGRALLTEHLLAFEVLSLLLLAAIIGAIVIARRRDMGVELQLPYLEPVRSHAEGGAVRPAAAQAIVPEPSAAMTAEPAARAVGEAR